jgi:hypothetical protein
MTEVAEKESTDLVVAPSKENALEVFKAEQGLDPYLLTIRRELDRFLENPPSLDTVTGRKAYASMAYKIARSKTAVDNVGKQLVAELKQLPKTIDAHRKEWRDKLDAMQEEARGPLNEWEAAEEARKAGIQSRIAEIRDMANVEGLGSREIYELYNKADAISVGKKFEEFQIEAHEAKAQVVEHLKAALDRQKKYEADQAELERMRQEAAAREQKEREERIAREAEERARREAEQAAQAEREAAARREQAARDEAARTEREAKEAAERREREHQEAISKAKRDAELAEQRAKEEYERKERERIAEQQRQEQARLDAERRQREEIERRQADVEHRRRINQAAMQAMIDGGMPEQCAMDAIKLIAQGKVPGVTINY